MSEIPWWGALLIAWVAGNIGVLLGVILSSKGCEEEEVAAVLQVEDVRHVWARPDIAHRMYR
jgi:hypothetical protein